MLRKLTPEQISDWFTIGKAVPAAEFLGGEPEAGGPRSPPAAQEPLTAAGLPVRESIGSECGEKLGQLDEEELGVLGNDQFFSKPDTSLSQCESSDWTPIPVTNHEYPDMPIAKHREEIVSLIESNSVVIVRGVTGSGKSTQIPQYVLDYCAQRSTYCNIAVTQPRKIGATSIARWISKERSWTLGGFVGYQVSLEKVSTKDTRLTYMTTGVLLQKLVCAKSLTEFTHIFVDEVHERTKEMDFLLLVIRKLLRTNSRFVKVILMSASINCKEFADYFAIPLHNKLNPAYIFEVEGKPYAIEEYYLDDLKHTFVFKLPPQIIEEPVIVKEMYHVAVSLIQSFDELEVKSSRENKSSSLMSERGSVLVFLPGLAEINYMHMCLTNTLNKRLQVYPLHSTVTLEEQNNVFLSPVPGYRKIILSTNIAESSLTVPDVKYVIDFCLTRTLICDEDTNYQSLRLCWASKTNCNQRKGRAGRVSKGYCYRLVHKDFWTNCIPEKPVPEILRCPLGTIILRIKMLDMGEPKALLATALSPPSAGDIERTILQLKELGALTSVQTEESPHDGELTFLGRVLAHLPVDQHLGKLIVLGHVFGCLEECLIIAAALSLRTFFAMPFRQHIDGYRNKLFFSGNSKSDCIALVNAFKAWQICRQKGELRHPKEELDWGRSNYIQIKRVREVAELFEELKERISAFNMHINTQPSPMDQEYVYKQRFILQVVIAGAFYPNYFTFGKCDQEIAVRELAGKDPKTTIMLKNIPPYGFLYHKQLQSLFRQCGQVKSIAYDGPKAFVEFSHNPMEGFKTLPAVYMSLKMSQLKIPLELNVHYPEEIERQLEGGTTARVKYARVNVDYQKQTVEPVEISFGISELSKMIPNHLLSINVTEVQKDYFLRFILLNLLHKNVHGFDNQNHYNRKAYVRVCLDEKYNANIQQIGILKPYDLMKNNLIREREMLLRFVVAIVEVGHFWGYRIDEKNMTILQTLTTDINHQNLMDLPVSPHPELVCLAPFPCLENKGYYRARILYVSGDFAEVFFVDYGNRSRVPLKKLKDIPSRLRELPFQALEFKMCKMRPSAKSLVCGEQWSYSASQRFASLVNGYTLLVKVYSLVHSVLHVDVFRYLGSKELVNIRDVLIEECYAEQAEESYESQQSHDLLKALLSDQIRKEEKKPPSSREEEKYPIEMLLNKFSVNKFGTPVHKVTLHGPFSPYEVKCYSMTRISRFRCAFIRKESINSVVVSDAPEDPFQQMLVAASLSVNATGSAVILEETSLMPPIPGLPALLSMLFAPAIELRVDKSGKYFTGVLCGLGWNQIHGTPLLPENDMELTFDVRFAVDDIAEINILRTAINKLVCECAACPGQGRMAQLQENVRQKLLSLICKSKPRDVIVPKWYDKSYAWNQVDSERIIDQSERQHERGNGLYQLHKLVVLNV